MQSSEISPNALYDTQTLYLTFGISQAALSRARRDGRLRHTRQGSRIVYLGQWLLDWLEREAAPREASK
jgi:hypothetical protein